MPDDLIERLLDPDWRGPMQHCRAWSDLDAIMDEAAAALAEQKAEIERLRTRDEETLSSLDAMGSEIAALRADLVETLRIRGIENAEHIARAARLAAAERALSDARALIWVSRPEHGSMREWNKLRAAYGSSRAVYDALVKETPSDG